MYGSERYAVAILRPLQSAALARGAEVAWFFDGPGAEDLAPEELLLRTVSDVKRWQPAAVLTSSNAVPHFFPGVKVQVFHGFNAGKPRHVYIRNFFDLYCTTGPPDTKDFSALAQQLDHFAVRETGWPKLDPLFQLNGFDSIAKRAVPTILYHSTFSPSWTAAPTLHDTVQELSQSRPWKWVVSLHPKTAAEIVESYRAMQSDKLQIFAGHNIHEVFSDADLMVSDTSSALSEFLLTYKPVVTFRNRRPGPHLIDIDAATDLASAIERALAKPPELMNNIRSYAHRVHPYRDGQSSNRVLDAIDDFIAHDAARLRPKPLNLLRKFKIERRLRYWGY